LFTAGLTYPSTSSAGLATTADVVAALTAMRCDYAALAGVPLGDVLISASQGADGSSSVAAEAVVAANLVASCTQAARRALATAGARAAQSAPGHQWATFYIAIAPPAAGAAVTSASIINAVAGPGADAFPATLAVWAPVWSLTPAAFVAAVGGGPVLLVDQPALVSNVTPTPSPAPTSQAALQLGLGLGLGIGVAVLAAAIAIAAFYFCRRTSHEDFSKPPGMVGTAPPDAATATAANHPHHLTALNSYRSQSLGQLTR
jgi:hypothetical protein